MNCRCLPHSNGCSFQVQPGPLQGYDISEVDCRGIRDADLDVASPSECHDDHLHAEEAASTTTHSTMHSVASHTEPAASHAPAHDDASAETSDGHEHHERDPHEHDPHDHDEAIPHHRAGHDRDREFDADRGPDRDMVHPGNGKPFTDGHVGCDHDHSEPQYSAPAEGSNGQGGYDIDGMPVWSLEGIADNLFRNGSWVDHGYPDTITYSFPSSPPSGYQFAFWDVAEAKQFHALSEPQQFIVHEAIDQLDDIIAPEFEFSGLHDNGFLRFMATSQDREGAAHAYGPNDVFDRAGDVWFHVDDNGNGMDEFDFGGSDIRVTMHEIGHAMGMKHPGNYNASDEGEETYETHATIYQDSLQYTVMSYFDPSYTTELNAEGDTLIAGESSTYSVHDIYALQREYGAEMNTRTGDDVYGFNATAGFEFDFDMITGLRFTVWDAGGFDTFDFSEAWEGCEIDLRPGHFSDLMSYSQNVSIAWDTWAPDPSLTWIEAALGSDHDDLIIGNEADNSLVGNAGEDQINGQTGDDLIYGGDDSDTLDGHSGNDVLYGGEGGDVMVDSTGLDTFYGGWVRTSSMRAVAMTTMTARRHRHDRLPLQPDRLECRSDRRHCPRTGGKTTRWQASSGSYCTTATTRCGCRQRVAKRRPATGDDHVYRREGARVESIDGGAGA